MGVNVVSKPGFEKKRNHSFSKKNLWFSSNNPTASSPHPGTLETEGGRAAGAAVGTATGTATGRSGVSPSKGP